MIRRFLMDFRAQYLQARREEAPSLFKRLSKSGQLENEANLAAREAERLFQEVTEDAPKDKDGQPSLQARREAEELVRAELLNFQNSETSMEQDEIDYLLGQGPLIRPR
jgi:hypothetical protein